jgi:ribose transport system ATP-binding protein
MSAVLEACGVSKSYGGVRALRDMDFALKAGEVHVLFGENGAGKSTLINVICGAIKPSSGTILRNGTEVRFRDVQDARRQGVAAMFQEFSLAPHLTVEENIFLGAEPRRGVFLRVGNRRQRVQEALDRFGFDVRPTDVVMHLSRAQQQMVEMTKALMTDPKVLILDEPTASLSQKETEAMYGLIAGLKARGVGIIYITHRMKEIEAIGDRVTVMRDGAFVATVDVAGTSQDRLVELMTGRQITALYPNIASSPGETALKIEGLTTVDGGIREADLTLHRGEIVGIAGLVGCGKSDLIRAVFGLSPIASGRIEVGGMHVARPVPRDMLARGVAYITSDRRNEGLMMLRPTRENLTLSAIGQPGLSRRGWMKLARERSVAQDLGTRLTVSPLQLEKSVLAYSGGNQQKIMIAKAIAREAKVFLFDEPTVGIDVGARVEVYNFLKNLVEAGAAVIIVSSDLPEVLNLSQRLLVVRDGKIIDEMKHAEISEARVLAGFFGTRAA